MILDIDKWVKDTTILGEYLPRITSSSIRLKNGMFDEHGLYSTKYFGQRGSDKWGKMFSVIELPHKILHPVYFYIINRRISTLVKWISLQLGGSYDTSTKSFTLNNNIGMCTYFGLSDLYDNPEIVCKGLLNSGKIDTQAGKVILNSLMKRDPKIWCSYIIVPPPLFRDIMASNSVGEEDKPFVKILDEISILRSVMQGKDKIVKNKILYNIQLLSNSVFDNMIGKIKGKSGLIRSSMLGRNSDFSGRAVIVGDPMIDADHIGVPKNMLVRLYFPWIINYILTHKDVSDELSKYTNVNKPSLHTLINEKLEQEDIDDNILDILYKVTEEVIKNKVIIAKRDPCLHKLSIRAYRPVMVDDSSIHISPGVCPGHNADFDGDQMAVFVPLTKESQAEAERMLASKNIWNPRSGLSVALEKEFPAVCFFITRLEPNKSKPCKIIDQNVSLIDEYLLQVEDFSEFIEYRGRRNSVGRRIIEVVFDDKIEVNEPVTTKKLESLFEKFSDDGEFIVKTVGKVQKISMPISSIMGGSISIDTFKLSKDLEEWRNKVLKNPEKYDVSTELKKITDEFTKRMVDSGQYAAVARESGQSKIDLQQLSVAKGYIADVSGNTDPVPIVSNFADGFSSTDYFRSAAGNRKGVVDRVMNTSKSGYLMRQMIYLLASLKAGNVKNCGTTKFAEVILTDEILPLLTGRVLSNGDVLTSDYAHKHNLLNKTIKYYSPMYCKSRDLCECCYPPSCRSHVNNVSNVGIIAAQVLGERTTQLTMKTFHTGGASKIVVLSTEFPVTGDYISQNGFDLTSEKDFKVRLLDPEKDGTNTYLTRDFILYMENGTEEKINFSALIEFDGLSASNVIEDDNGDVILEFEAGNIIGRVDTSAADVTSATLLLQSILDHTDRYEIPEQIVMDLYETFKIASKIPFIYLEMITSQLTRDPSNPVYPYRLGKMNANPIFAGIKRVSALENPVRGMMFERISDVLINTVINGDKEDKNRPKSDLEDLFRL